MGYAIGKFTAALNYTLDNKWSTIYFLIEQIFYIPNTKQARVYYSGQRH